MNREEGRRGYIEYPCILKGFFSAVKGRQELRQVKELQYIRKVVKKYFIVNFHPKLNSFKHQIIL
jgi:hypothetical protein